MRKAKTLPPQGLGSSPDQGWVGGSVTGGIAAALTGDAGFLEGWPILLAVTGIPAVMELLLLPFFPESPRYLLVRKKDQPAARKGEAVLWEEGKGQQRRISAPGKWRPSLRRPLASSLSAAEAARLGRGGRRDGGDPTGRRGREG